MLGLYPLRMGTDEYVIGSPLFERIEVQMDNGHALRVIAHNNSRENVYVQSLKVNGKTWNNTWLNHSEIARGGTLEFVMGPEPSTWGRDSLPPSLTAPGKSPQFWFDHASRASSIHIDRGPPAQALIDDDAMSSVALPAGTNITLQLEQPALAEYYTLTNAAQALTGLEWALEGRNDGSWQTLDTRTAQDFAWARQLRPFRIAQPGQYQQYRLRFAASTQALDLSQWELLQRVEYGRDQPQSENL